MSGFDLFLLLVVGVGAVKGFRRGLVLEVASLLAFVLGVIGGLMLLNDAIPLVRHYAGEAFGLLPIVSFLLVFALIGWGVHLLGSFVKSAVHLTPLGLLDNLLGGAAGALKWVLGLSLLLHGLGLAGVHLLSPALTANSRCCPWCGRPRPLLWK